MCLGRVEFTKKGLGRKVFIGYKVFRPSVKGEGNYLYYHYWLHGGSAVVICDKWLVAEQNKIFPIGTRPYFTGFHIYKEKQDAVWDSGGNEGVVKVKYKGVLAKGTEMGRSVVVAKYMWVPRQRKKR